MEIPHDYCASEMQEYDVQSRRAVVVLCCHEELIGEAILCLHCGSCRREHCQGSIRRKETQRIIVCDGYIALRRIAADIP